MLHEERVDLASRVRLILGGGVADARDALANGASASKRWPPLLVEDRRPEGERARLHPYQPLFGLRGGAEPGHGDGLGPGRTEREHADAAWPPVEGGVGTGGRVEQPLGRPPLRLD